MLSNLRIGKKLFVGFGLLIILLLIVGGVGWMSLRNVDQGTDRTLEQINVFIQCNDAVISSYEAQLASNQHSISQNPAWNAKVKENVEKVSLACDTAITKYMQREDMKEMARAVDNEAKNYLRLDTEFMGIVENIRKGEVARDAALQKTNEGIRKLAEELSQTSCVQ